MKRLPLCDKKVYKTCRSVVVRILPVNKLNKTKMLIGVTTLTNKDIMGEPNSICQPIMKAINR